MCRSSKCVQRNCTNNNNSYMRLSRLEYSYGATICRKHSTILYITHSHELTKIPYIPATIYEGIIWNEWKYNNQTANTTLVTHNIQRNRYAENTCLYLHHVMLTRWCRRFTPRLKFSGSVCFIRIITRSSLHIENH